MKYNESWKILNIIFKICLTILFSKYKLYNKYYLKSVFIFNTIENSYLHTLLSGLGVSVELRGTESNIIVIKIVDIKTIGPIL